MIAGKKSGSKIKKKDDGDNGRESGGGCGGGGDGSGSLPSPVLDSERKKTFFCSELVAVS